MYLTLTPTATEFINSANDALTKNETSALLWLLVGLVLIVGTLIGVMWSALTAKVNKIDDNQTATLRNQGELNIKVDHLENQFDRLDGRILTVERKIGNFLTP